MDTRITRRRSLATLGGLAAVALGWKPETIKGGAGSSGVSDSGYVGAITLGVHRS